MLLFLVSLGSYWHLDTTAERNNRSLKATEKLSRGLSHGLGHLHDVILTAHEQASAEKPEHRALLVMHMQMAVGNILELERDHVAANANLDIEPLKLLLQKLSSNLDEYIRLRQDTDWVYPTLPYLTQTLRLSNLQFESEIALVINDVEQNLDDPEQLSLYRDLIHLRSYWRRMILSFRSAMIRFAGLPDRDAVNEEADVRELYDAAMQNLQQLQARLTDDSDLLLSESLDAMEQAARRWKDDFKRLREVRKTGNWRGDVTYINSEFLPLYREIEKQIEALQEKATLLSQETSSAFSSAADRLNLLLWIITALGITIISGLYLVLDRAILKPITQVANALSEESIRNLPHELPDNPNREIQQLTDAFQRMREQVHGRQQALEHQATHDVLTGLPNRALMHDRLSQALAQSKRESTTCALLLLDLDRFKDINDSLGHQVGDDVLRIVAERLSSLGRASDTVARLGGDEFALVLPGMNRSQAVTFAQRVADSLTRPFALVEHQLFAGVSIGIVIAPEEGDNVETLIRLADNAMYSAKRSDRHYAFFDPEHDERIAAGVTLASALQKQLERATGLTLYYQPRLDAKSGVITSAEALLRWQTEDGEWISPERILHAADHAHIQNALSCWILDRAIGDCAWLNTQGLPLKISINLTASDAQDARLPDRLAELCTRHQVPAEQLILEITENALLADPEQAGRILTRLADAGLSISIDDFGTGFSSLAHLRMLPVSELKIDRSFVMGMTESENDRAIVNSTIDLGHNLGLVVVAEGVENEDIQQQLIERRCDQLQGYHIGRPMPLAELAERLGPDDDLAAAPAPVKSPASR